MTSERDAERIEALTAAVATLAARLERVEAQLGDARPWPTVRRSPGPFRQPVDLGQPAPVGPASHPSSSPGDTVRASIPAWWQVGPLRHVTPERLPAVALAATGGLALTFGLLFFVWHAVDQGWLAPGVRVVLGSATGVALMAVAWFLGPRNRAVAGALGGAGLGSWYASWLVARHLHGLVGHTETFVALALGAAACLVIAGHRRLRSMAFLAGLAAYATPVATATGADRLHELMIYQVVLMGALWGLEQARKWPELVMLALVGTWASMLGWAHAHLSPVRVEALLVWCAAVLALGSFQAFQAAKAGARSTAALRYGVGGVLCWVAVTWACVVEFELALPATLVMALWNLGMAGLLFQRKAPRLVIGVALTLGWLQFFEVGPVGFDDRNLAAWWSFQTAIAVLAYCWRPTWGAARLWLAPGVGVLGWVFASGTRPDALAFGWGAAATLLLMAAWPKSLAPARPDDEGLLSEGHRSLTWVCASAGLLAWMMVAERQLRPFGFVEWPALSLALVALGWVAWSLRRPSVVNLQVGVAAVGSVLWMVIADAVRRDLFGLFGPSEGGVALVLVTLGLATAGAAGLAAALRSRHPASMRAHGGAVHDAAGVVVPTALTLAGMIAWSAMLRVAIPDLQVASSLQQAGWSVTSAIAALGLVVAGLFLDRAVWRKLGVVALFVVAAKVVLVDLSHVDLAWRVVSFAGLGACLIAGAWAYGHFEKRRPRPT